MSLIGICWLVKNFMNDGGKSCEEHEIAEEMFKRCFKAKATSLKLMGDGRFIVFEHSNIVQLAFAGALMAFLLFLKIF